MVTKDNLKDVISSLSNKDKKRILNSSKEFTVIYLHVFNAGWYATIRLTDDYNRYKNVSYNGNAILYTIEVQDLLKGL